MTTSQRDEALQLAEDLLTDIELARISPVDLARKASRLARILDDTQAVQWLRHETSGYSQVVLDDDAMRAATRSNRDAPPADDGSPQWWTTHLATLAADAEAARTELQATGPGISRADNAWAINVERERTAHQRALRSLISDRDTLIQRVIGALYDYASARYQELRFGAAVGTAFDVVRQHVDGRIAQLVPDALPKLSAAFENATSSNPEDWASAAATCRRLLKAAADALRPPGPDKDGRRMDDDHYLNRLIDWIVAQASSATAADMISADVQYLGMRLEAVLDAGHKGAHAEVTQFDASRFVTGTYLLLGDVLRLAPTE